MTRQHDPIQPICPSCGAPVQSQLGLALGLCSCGTRFAFAIELASPQIPPSPRLEPRLARQLEVA